MDVGYSPVDPHLAAECRRGGDTCINRYRQFWVTIWDGSIVIPTGPWGLLVIHQPLSPLWIATLIHLICQFLRNFIINIRVNHDSFQPVHLLKLHIAGFENLPALMVIEQVCLFFFHNTYVNTLNRAFT